MERKLAAILSADVVGYSRLMAEDQEGTVRTLTAYREQIGSLVREHRGRLADFTGDNFLAEFPSALDAVECAIEIQRVLRARNADLPADRKMEFRIGAHLGDVAVDGERVYGDGVNIAARLEALAEAGGICISATVHEQVRNKLSVGYQDLGDKTVKNIPEQVHVYRVGLDAPAEAAGAKLEASRSRLPRVLGVAAAILVLLGVGVWATWPRLLGLGLGMTGLVPSDAPSLPDVPSLVVLPFANMSSDPGQEYFSDGITEELTNALAGNQLIFVISRNSAFTYKNRAVKVEDIGRELGVRYVLEGSVRKAGDSVRITAQLIDVASGFHRWSKQYDRKLDDIFAVQSEISEEILAAVGVEIGAAELARIQRKPTDDLNAYDVFTRGLSLFARYTKKDHEESRELFRTATELDPDFAMAWALLGATYSAEYALGWTFDPNAPRLAEEYARRAIEIDPSHPNGYAAMASLTIVQGENEIGLGFADKAVELAPSFPVSHLFRGFALTRLGRFAEGLAALRRGLRLDPRLEGRGPSMSLVANIYAQTGRESEAADLWESACRSDPELVAPRLQLIQYHASAGRNDAARAHLAELRSTNPHVTPERAQEILERSSGLDAAAAAAVVATLRDLGLS